VVASLTLLLAGCSSASVTDARPAGATQSGGPQNGVSDQALAALQKGMTTEQVRNLLGQPAEIKPFKTGEIGAYVWTYRRSLNSGVRQVTTGMREVPYIDPLTGATRTMREPVYSNEIIVIHETVELLMFQDRLAEWKRSRTNERIYN
jgi:hypothetical protein